jgi:hypothetical protein
MRAKSAALLLLMCVLGGGTALAQTYTVTPISYPPYTYRERP